MVGTASTVCHLLTVLVHLSVASLETVIMIMIWFQSSGITWTFIRQPIGNGTRLMVAQLSINMKKMHPSLNFIDHCITFKHPKRRIFIILSNLIDASCSKVCDGELDLLELIIWRLSVTACSSWQVVSGVESSDERRSCRRCAFIENRFVLCTATSHHQRCLFMTSSLPATRTRMGIHLSGRNAFGVGSFFWDIGTYGEERRCFVCRRVRPEEERRWWFRLVHFLFLSFLPIVPSLFPSLLHLSMQQQVGVCSGW